MPRESDQALSRLGRLVQFGQVGQQFFFVSHAAEVPADHLVSPQRGLLPGPQADQHAGDDRAADLPRLCIGKGVMPL